MICLNFQVNTSSRSRERLISFFERGAVVTHNCFRALKIFLKKFLLEFGGPLRSNIFSILNKLWGVIRTIRRLVLLRVIFGDIARFTSPIEHFLQFKQIYAKLRRFPLRNVCILNIFEKL